MLRSTSTISRGCSRTTNRLAEAESLYRRALAILEKGLGPDHPNTILVRNNLAGLKAALGKGG
jgi:hypothetical protein